MGQSDPSPLTRLALIKVDWPVMFCSQLLHPLKQCLVIFYWMKSVGVRPARRKHCGCPKRPARAHILMQARGCGPEIVFMTVM